MRAAQKAAKLEGNIELSKRIKNLMALDLGESSISEVLAFHLDNKLSKAQYNNLRKLLLARAIEDLPSYPRLMEEKTQCYPKNVVVTERVGTVSVQQLFNHTIQRLMQCEEVANLSASLKDDVKATLFFSWGFDGSTGKVISSDFLTIFQLFPKFI